MLIYWTLFCINNPSIFPGSIGNSGKTGRCNSGGLQLLLHTTECY